MEIICYKTSDGLLFEDNRKAESHQVDIIGEIIDGLLPHDDRGNVTSVDRFNIITKMMDDPAFKEKISSLYYAVSFNDNGGE